MGRLGGEGGDLVSTSDLCPAPQNLALLVVGLGAFFSFIFHLGTPEGRRPPGTRSELPTEDEHSPLLAPGVARPLLLWKDWLRQPAFYQV